MRQQAVIPIIRDADRGQVLADMQDGLDRIVEAIETNRGQGTGKITLTLTVKSKSEGTYSIASSLAVKVPEAARADMVMFLDTESGELIRRDPRQPDLPGVTTIEPRGQSQDQQ